MRLAEEAHKDLRAYFLGLALRRSAENLVAKFSAVPFEPYGPVKAQIFSIRGDVDDVRRRASYRQIPKAAIWLKRRYVKLFQTPDGSAA